MSNVRDRNREPDFATLTKFVVNKAKLANTEYGRLVNVKMDSDKGKPRSFGNSQRNVLAYQVSNGIPSEDRGERNLAIKSKCIFCSKDGHSLGRCFMFQERSYAERKKFVSEKGLCNLCLSKGHFANSQRGRKCFVARCDRQREK